MSEHTEDPISRAIEQIQEETQPEEVFQNVADTFLPEGIYLSGPIRCVDDNGVTWRQKVTEKYSDEYEIKSPLDVYDPSEVEILCDPNDWDDDKDNQILPTEYVLEDKMMIARSEAIFVGLPEEIARGTMMECMWGYAVMNRPLFVWTIDGQEESGWIHDHARIVSDDLESVFSELERWLS